MTEQPEALRLADQIHHGNGEWMQQAAAELRRLHALNAELLEALKDVMYWDNGKPEWEAARDAIAKAQGESNE